MNYYIPFGITVNTIIMFRSWDVDDVAAVCMANALADRREAELLAIVHDTGYPEVCPLSSDTVQLFLLL